MHCKHCGEPAKYPTNDGDAECHDCRGDSNPPRGTTLADHGGSGQTTLNAWGPDE